MSVALNLKSQRRYLTTKYHRKPLCMQTDQHGRLYKRPFTVGTKFAKIKISSRCTNNTKKRLYV